MGSPALAGGPMQFRKIRSVGTATPELRHNRKGSTECVPPEK